MLLGFGGFVEPFVDGGHLAYPALTLGVLHLQYRFRRPVEMVREIGYLLMQPVEGVAGYPPRLPMSTSISAEHSGQVATTLAVPCSFTCR